MMLQALAVAFGVVFVAELGDKSQLTAALFATRYPIGQVLTAIGAATALLMAMSVAIGELAATAIPRSVIGLLAGLLFIGFGLRSLIDATSAEDEGLTDEDAPLGATQRSPIITMASTFFVAELGDKTMLATISLAATWNAAGVWGGATLGMFLADALAVVAGKLIGDRMPRRAIAMVAGVSFIALGIFIVIDAL